MNTYYPATLKPAISFYEDLVIENYKFLENEFEFWKQKCSSEKNCIPKIPLGTLPKCPEELFSNINVFFKNFIYITSINCISRK